MCNQRNSPLNHSGVHTQPVGQSKRQEYGIDASQSSAPLFFESEFRALEQDWRTNPRWQGLCRNYGAEAVLLLRGTLHIEHSIASQMSRKLWSLLHKELFVPALGALTGHQAVQMAQAGLKAVYVSGWQVAADANLAGATFPYQSLYPANSVPLLLRRLNKALERADQVQRLNHEKRSDFWVPLVADAEAGFGGILNAYELMLQMIEAGAAGVHFEDQLASVKKCGTWAARCWSRLSNLSASSLPRAWPRM